jgi:predicted GNAT superfamily acetyltransferase
MKLLFENWRQYLKEELNNQNSDFETWHKEVIEGLTKDGYDPVKYEKGAKRSYLDGETTVDYEIGWLEKMGLL